MPKYCAIWIFTSSLGILSPRSYIAHEDLVIPTAFAISSCVFSPRRSLRIFPKSILSRPFSCTIRA
nr:MAG TPA: hypothetical protein [Caudoviricetes sp.]